MLLNTFCQVCFAIMKPPSALFCFAEQQMGVRVVLAVLLPEAASYGERFDTSEEQLESLSLRNECVVSNQQRDIGCGTICHGVAGGAGNRATHVHRDTVTDSKVGRGQTVD